MATSFTVNRLALLRELQVADTVREAKTTIPIIDNILITVTDTSVKLAATDLDRSLLTECPVTKASPGVIALPARKLLDYLKVLDGEEVRFELQENHWAAIRCGRSRTKMVGSNPASFPMRPVFPVAASMRIPAGILRKLVDLVAFAVSSEESRYTLNGAQLTIKPGSMTMVATDGHRLAIATAPQDAVKTDTMQLVLPQRSFKPLEMLMGNTDPAETIEFAEDGSQMYFRVGPRLYCSRKLSATFPNWEAVVPKALPIKVSVPRSVLGYALLRVAQFADERSSAIRFTLANGTLKLSASTVESGESEEDLTVTYDGEPVTIGLNSNYLSQPLKLIAGPEVTIEANNAQSAIKLSVPSDDAGLEYTVVIMPTRV